MNNIKNKIIKYVVFLVLSYFILILLPKDEIYWKDTLTILSSITTIFILSDLYFPSVHVVQIEPTI
jgi:hypothetical protein